MLTTPEKVRNWAAIRESWKADPILYAKFRLGVNPTIQQQRVLRAIAKPGAKVSVRAGHGVGKTNVLAIIIWWMMETHDFPKIPCTAPSSSQLRDVLWAELSKLMRQSDLVSKARGLEEGFYLSRLFRMTQDRVMAEGFAEQWFASARTARKEAPDALQGFHASDLLLSADGTVIEKIGEDANLLFIIDEAPGVPDEVYMVAEGALSSHGSRLIMMGNPTKNVGYFADSHKGNRGSFTTMHFSCVDSPLVDKDYRSRLVRQFGEGSNIVRVRADGEFPKQDDAALISLEWVESALIRQRPMVDNNRIILGVDVARFGDDRTTLVKRQGRHVQDILVYAKKDTMETAGIVNDYCMRHQIDDIMVDANGVGAGVADRLRELNLPTTDVMVAESAPERRPNREREDRVDMIPHRLRDHIYLEMMKWYRDEEPSFEGAPADYAQTLTGECVSLMYKFDSSGRIVVESKVDMKRRGLRSPDLADGLALTFAPNSGSIWERL
jgi:hypothetical protein